jgi:microsomal epoxide hydrolase
MAPHTLTRRDVFARAAGLAAAAVAGSGHDAVAAPPQPAADRGVSPFRVDIPRARIDRILARVRDVEWPDAPEDPDPWSYGTSLAVMKDLVQHWLTRYDWRARQAAMNRLPQFKARVEDYDIHFVHVRGSGPNPRPIIFSHGWPNTFLEFAKVVEPLAHPDAHGGSVEDAFSVVVPSLPGYAFSSKPRRPIGAPTTARLWDRLMTDVLGYRGYIAQGGDLGFTISREIGYTSRNCAAIHLNHLLGIGAPSITPEEKQAEATRASWTRAEGAYMAIQSTKPLTISYAMSNSPVGVAAWVLEKIRAWSGLTNGDPWSVYTRDEVLDNIMMFIITNTYGTGAWYYAASRTEPPSGPRGALEKPTGFAEYPAHVSSVGMWPRSYAERNYNVVWWSKPPAGGHFPADEVPDLFTEDIRSFNRHLRSLGV